MRQSARDRHGQDAAMTGTIAPMLSKVGDMVLFKKYGPEIDPRSKARNIS